jgi:hypothetical protein
MVCPTNQLPARRRKAKPSGGAQEEEKRASWAGRAEPFRTPGRQSRSLHLRELVIWTSVGLALPPTSGNAEGVVAAATVTVGKGTHFVSADHGLCPLPQTSGRG